MRKIITRLLLIASVCSIGTAFVSCGDDGNDFREEWIQYDKLPVMAQAFIVEYYSGVNVARVEKDYDDGVKIYEVTMANRHEITFSSSGEWVEVEAPDGVAIPSGIAPEPIEWYLYEHFHGYGINNITRTGYGYEVELVTGLDLMFDSAGYLIGVDR